MKGSCSPGRAFLLSGNYVVQATLNRLYRVNDLACDASQLLYTPTKHPYGLIFTGNCLD
jgi:hypothetical protein